MIMIKLSLIQTTALGVLVYLLGKYIVDRNPFLARYCIPAPVVGGLLVSLIHWGLYNFQILNITFDMTLQSFFMIAFFSTIGFSASWRIIKQGGIAIVILVIASSVMLVIQNVIGVSIARAFDIHPLIGLCAGAISLMGGVGSSAAFAPTMEANGAVGGLPVAITCATFGLAIAALISGPISRYLIDRDDLVRKAEEKDQLGEGDRIDYSALEVEEEVEVVKAINIHKAFYQIMIAMGLGTLISMAIEMTGLLFPAYVGAIFAAAFLRNAGESMNWKIYAQEIEVLGSLFLNVFLAMTIMSLQLWKIVHMAGPLVLIMVAQVVVLAIFSIFVIYNVLGRDYDAAVMAAGFYGYAMGATPNGVASMNAVVNRYNRPSTKSFFTVPIVGGFLMDFAMAILIIGHMNLILQGVL